MSINFNTSNSTYRQLLGNGLRYRVPPFQRDYSWSEVEWDELWQDIEALFGEDAEPAHYMGYLVLQSTDSKHFDIIDGQQRITTISIMILAGLGVLKDLMNEGIDTQRNHQRLTQLKSNYIGYTDPVTLIETPKLQLNRHNDKYYRNYLITLEKLPQRGLHASEHKIRKAFGWFKSKIKGRVGRQKNSGEQFAQFLDTLVDKLFFTVIYVDDELNAFKVFETLNARGVRLSSTDLLKNYLFSLASVDGLHGSQIKNLEERWEHIISLLGSESFPEFLRVYWNSQHKLARKTELFKVIRKRIRDKADAFKLMRSIELSADAYTALKDSNDSRWTPQESKYLQQIGLYRVKQPFSMLLVSYEQFFDNNRQGFADILRAISVLSFRYNIICNNPPNEQERFYNKVALAITNGNLATPAMVIRSLADIYPDDDIFRQAFAKKQLKTTDHRNKKIVRHILCELERQTFGASIDETTEKFNIEHILPEHPAEHWQHIEDNQLESMVYRLGNMMMLETTLNKDASNLPFIDKAVIYQSSTLDTPKEIVETYKDWHLDNIEHRQQQMAKQATSIWKISQLSK